MDVFKMVKELHEQGYHVEVCFSYLHLRDKEHPYYCVALYRNFVRSVGFSENSIEEALINALKKREEECQQKISQYCNSLRKTVMEELEETKRISEQLAEFEKLIANPQPVKDFIYGRPYRTNV